MHLSTPVSLRPTALLATLVLALGLLAARAEAQSWTEFGDAGATIATAQNTAGSGPLTQIIGNLSSTSDVDIYCITVANTQTFSAALLCLAQADPSLWLFRANGTGVALNDLCQFGDKDIPAGWVTSTGTYYLAVAAQGVQAQTVSGAMWQTGLFTGPRAPDGPGAAGTLIGWGGVGMSSPLMHYTLNLTGVIYCTAAVPALDPTWGTLKLHYR